jgi:stage II sporulation protein D
MKKARYSFIIVLLALMYPSSIHSQRLKIGLFNENSIQAFIFSVVSGNYQLRIDSARSLMIDKGAVLYISLLDSQLSIKDVKSGSLLVSYLQLIGHDSSATFSLRPAFPPMEARSFGGNCLFIAGIGRIQVVNEVKLNDYLEAVVAAEGGPSAAIEYYKAQSVLCRTFLYAHLTKHATDNFNLCDGVHCQAYHGLRDLNPEIHEAVIATENELAVYSDTALITAAYHANCGGETQNSENEWLQMLPYLRSVKDSFCLNSRNSKWEKKLTQDNWLTYLAKNGVHYDKKDGLKSLNFTQITRTAYYVVEGDSIAFRKIRSDWGLKSSFFSVEVDSTGEILLHGKGYGHGIGMCQMGAMNMARRGYRYMEILNFYFRNISVKKADQLNFTTFQ